MQGWKRTLTWEQLEFAAKVGLQRNIQCLKEGRFHRYGSKKPEMGWTWNCEGAAGEYLVALEFRFPWDGNLGNFRADDAGPLQVRTSPKHNADLRLHDSDKDHKAFVLVTGVAPNLVMRGWLFAHEGKKNRYWRDGAKGQPAYWIKQRYLRPMETLARYLERTVNDNRSRRGYGTLLSADDYRSDFRRRGRDVSRG